MSPWSAAAIILFLLLASGFLSMVEIALVLSRESKLAGRDDAGDALALVRAPDSALSGIQTLATFCAVSIGALSDGGVSTALAGYLGPLAGGGGWAVAAARIILALFTAAILLLFGQLLPKRIGLAYPEAVLRLTAGTLRFWSRIFSPLPRLFGSLADAIAALLQIKTSEAESLNEDDVKQMVREGGRSGALLPGESEMVEAVLALDSLRVRELMTPRGEIVWLDAALPAETLFDQMLGSTHTRFPIYEHRRDNVIGVVSIRDVFALRREHGIPDVRKLAKPPLMVPPTQPVNRLLETFRSSGSTFALVADEFGGISGVITMQDAIEAIIGDFHSAGAEPAIVTRQDGSWLVDASLAFDEVLGNFPGFPSEAAAGRHYVTLNGYILQRLDHIPATGETLEAGPYRLEVLDLDRNRVDKLLVTRIAPGDSAED